MNKETLNKVEIGYYSTETFSFEDHHANHVERGSIKKFLVFLNDTEFLCTAWKNKEFLRRDDISTIQRGGRFEVNGDEIILTYDPNGWTEKCTIVEEHVFIYHFWERKMFFREWNNDNDENDN